MAASPRSVHCQLRSSFPDVPPRSTPASVSLPKLKSAHSDTPKILLQPRLCTLRSFGSDPVVPIKAKRVASGDASDDDVSRFFATLSEYIESSKDSHEFEIISGRLAMIVFAATVTMEVVTGNSVFRKMDLEGIEEAAGVCLGAVTLAAIFAFSSNARNRVGRIFSISCNTFIDSLIDQIVDGLFYENDPSDLYDGN
ncbi:stress enhanced protein 2, chloroplastic-like [Cucurbita maxima]|uniref:Stress enhanced protein 2, chloroplastic-like n=1 Tax=Cucurbita maxima TaxID=3661 RepID=A0A6J1IRM7_CUCMA|nr:stress enhanced protein 2, chloroplastic-like [Cucurbita maxima]XP_022977953.1 stress enhanced protein 2, chloroplastic-like [Cucurbita maxima]